MGLWETCLGHLETGLSAQEFNNWIRPLQAVEASAGMRLLAPNRFLLVVASPADAVIKLPYRPPK